MATTIYVYRGFASVELLSGFVLARQCVPAKRVHQRRETSSSTKVSETLQIESKSLEEMSDAVGDAYFCLSFDFGHHGRIGFHASLSFHGEEGSIIKT